MEQREPVGKKSWVGVIVGLGLIFFLFAICTSIAIPNFMNFGKKSKTSEVKSNLKAAYTGEKSYFSEKDVYSDSIEEIGFLPERNRYLYLVSKGCDLFMPGTTPDGGAHCGVLADERLGPTPDNKMLLASIPSSLRGEAGVQCEDDGGCDVTIIAVGDIDGDPAVDLWSISTKVRVIGADTVTAGMPYNHVNDVEK